MSGYIIIESPELGERRQLESDDDSYRRGFLSRDDERWTVEAAMAERLRAANLDGSVRTYLVTGDAAARMLSTTYVNAQPVSPFVRRAQSGKLPAKELSR